MTPLIQMLWLIPLGVGVGAYGTLIGAGGGFVLVPVLLLLYRHEPAEIVASISLAVVFMNALSGSIAYARQRRIDWRSAAFFAAATVPGAILGALTTARIPRRTFDGILGAVLLLASAFLIWRPARRPAAARPPSSDEARSIVDADGIRHVYAYNRALGIGSSVLVGYCSSLLGIGGGIIHVPVLSYLLNFPVHIATATSHSILAVSALTGTLVHMAMGEFSRGIRRTIGLSIGVVIGAQIGARFAPHLQGSWIMRGLALALGLVGLRILFLSFGAG